MGVHPIGVYGPASQGHASHRYASHRHAEGVRLVDNNNGARIAPRERTGREYLIVSLGLCHLFKCSLHTSTPR
jgi:hypothetical protein